MATRGWSRRAGTSQRDGERASSQRMAGSQRGPETTPLTRSDPCLRRNDVCRRYWSENDRIFRDRLGCFSFRSAFASIWQMRSSVIKLERRRRSAVQVAWAIRIHRNHFAAFATAPPSAAQIGKAAGHPLEKLLLHSPLLPQPHALVTGRHIRLWGHRSSRYWSKKLRIFLDRLGCFNFRSALASICRIRSRVTLNCCPTSSSV